MNSAVSRWAFAVVALALVVKSVHSLTCYTGGGAGAVGAYVPNECETLELLCKYKKASVLGVEMKLAMGCETPSLTKIPVRNCTEFERGQSTNVS